MAFQILVFYTVIILVICYFFRKFCGDPDRDESGDEAPEQDTVEGEPIVGEPRKSKKGSTKK